MFHALKIIIVTALAHYAAYFVLSRITEYEKQLKQYMITSITVLGVAVLSHSILLGYLVTAVFCIVQNQRSDPSTKIAYFFGIAFSVSYFGGVMLNPGIMLGSLSHPRILILTLLLPLLLTARPEREIFRFNSLDKVVIAFFLWLALMHFRAPTLTGMIRQNVWMVMDFLVPYIAIRRYLSNYALVLAALSFALISQAGVGIIEAVMKWHIHTDVEMLAGFADPIMAQYKFRGRFLRVQASFMNPLIFALFANMAFLTAVIYISKVGIHVPKTYTKMMAWTALGITALGTISSGSRAGVAGSFLIVIVSLMLLWAIKRKRDPKQMLVSIFSAIILGLYLFGGDFFRKHFDYRVRLVEVSSEVIMSNPLFGSTHVHDDPRMQVLHLGEGIIDIVNTYVEFALSYGLPALILFVLAIGKGLSLLYNSLRHCEGERLALGIFAFASIFILAFNLATASAFGWTYPWIWICIGLASNIVARGEADKKRERKLRNEQKRAEFTEADSP